MVIDKGCLGLTPIQLLQLLIWISLLLHNCYIMLNLLFFIDVYTVIVISVVILLIILFFWNCIIISCELLSISFGVMLK